MKRFCATDSLGRGIVGPVTLCREVVTWAGVPPSQDFRGNLISGITRGPGASGAMSLRQSAGAPVRRLGEPIQTQARPSIANDTSADLRCQSMRYMNVHAGRLQWRPGQVTLVMCQTTVAMCCAPADGPSCWQKRGVGEMVDSADGLCAAIGQFEHRPRPG